MFLRRLLYELRLKSRRIIGGRKKNKFLLLAFAIMGLLILLYLIVHFLFYGSGPAITENPVTKAVHQFYKYEEKGDFGSSYEMFHSQMKEKFKKETYIQQRAHIFMEHFGVNTFEYKVGSSQSLATWQMSPKAAQLTDIYRVPVTQTFQSNYGNFAIVQDVFVVKENNDYRILWVFSK